ncbi:MAG: peptide chain release factor N(5)-glutamine methyltransferase [Candidatus Aquicultorales bacterium]
MRSPQKVRDAIRDLEGRLAPATPTPRAEAELILSHLLEAGRTELYAEGEREIPAKTIDRVEEIVAARLAGEPLQYLLGSVSFCGVELRVRPGVLIPRPETEILAARASNALKAMGGRPVVLDLCAGSGALAVYLARECPAARVVAADISDEALALIEENAELSGVADRVRVRKSDLFSGLVDLKRAVDLLVSNPPYIPSGRLETLPVEVRREPAAALDGGADGLDFYRRISREAPSYIKSGGLILLEIGEDQAGAVSSLLMEADFSDIQVIRDLIGADRVVGGERPME